MESNLIEQRFTNTARSKTVKNLIQLFGLDKKAVLDIGCSFGEFTALFGPKSVGITIDEEEARYGKKRGLDLRYGNIESDDFDLSDKFDAIFANNIFEHLHSPHKFLCKIKKYLKPEGILILGVPCLPKITFLLKFKKFRGCLADSHINFFTRDTLIKTNERAGWQPELTRGFHFKNKYVDRLLQPIYPHFYCVSKINTDFHYKEKRLKELQGYKNIKI